jgi:hypothetical protein
LRKYESATGDGGVSIAASIILFWIIPLTLFLCSLTQYLSEFNNLYLAFILHKSDVKKYLEKCMLHPEKNSWFLFIGDARRQFFMGLASYYLYRNTRDIRWAEKGSKCKANLQQWAEQGCSWNFRYVM